jgi:hypothetical protein
MIKTVRGYINALNRIEKNGVMILKGYYSLSKEQQEALGIISAELSNTLAEFEDVKKEVKGC